MKEIGGHRKSDLRGRRRRPKQSHELLLTIPQIIKFGTRICDNLQFADNFMRVPYFILPPFLLCLVLACNDKIETQVEDVSMTETVRAPEPPPPSFSCLNSVPLQEWFFKLCDTEKPKKDVIAYNFGLFGSDNCYAIHLVDSIQYEKDDRDTARKNEPDASVSYYPLSKSEYEALEWKQVLNKIKSQLEEFVKTERFKNSYLAKAKIITMRFDDGDLLSLK